MAQILFLAFVTLLVLDFVLLFRSRQGVSAQRVIDDRMSHSDKNEVRLTLTSHLAFRCKISIIDELPYQLQLRHHELKVKLGPLSRVALTYTLEPKERGEYNFGRVNLLITSPLKLVVRRIKGGKPQTVKVYPSYLRLHQYELAAISNRLTQHGQKRIRKIGNSQEFDNIRSYVFGDDPRHINWKATARRNALQVNHFVDERSQNLYCLIDKSRSMKMPFDGMTLVDYAINASLVLSYVALNKSDRTGLISFENVTSSFIKAARQNNQIHLVIEALYKEQTSFKEVDFSSLYTFTQKNLTERSLLVLFTNFESLGSLNRQLPYLKLLNRKHLLLVVFFRNTEVDKLINRKNGSTEQIYQESVAVHQLSQKQLIEDTLKKHGILSLYTAPKDLSVNVINKYIQIKSRRLL